MPSLVLRVICPKCGKEQKTTSLKRRVCIACGHSFAIFPKGKKSRVVGIEKGSYDLLVKKYYEVGRYARRR